MLAHCLSFLATPANPSSDIKIQVQLDDVELWSGPIMAPTTISCVFDRKQKTRCLQISFSGKNHTHTVINDQGQILQDSTVHFDNFYLDQMKIDSIIVNQFCYQHNNNSNTELKNYPFYGTMGCNGTATLTFLTPMFDWLLEKI